MQLKKEDYDNIKADVVGRWHGILERFGIQIGDGSHIPCPICGGTDRARWVDDGEREGLFCGQCDPQFRDGWSVFMAYMKVDFRTACERIAPIVGHIDKSSFKPVLYDKSKMVELYKSSRPVIKGDLVWKYLCGRGLEKMDTPALRYSNTCYESETNQNQNAMLAIFQDSDGDALTFHRTYLDGDGNKLNVKSPKKIMTPKRPMPGGAVRLYEWVDGPLGVAEGIETAIAVSIVRGIPVWACLSTSLLKSFKPPEGITRLEIYGDNDSNFAGQVAAYTLANKIKLDRNIPIDVHFPAKQDTDFLDELKGEI